MINASRKSGSQEYLHPGGFQSYNSPDESTSQHDEESGVQSDFVDKQQCNYLDETGVSTRQSLMYLIKANLGIAILAVPYAFHYGGIWFGPGAMCMIGVITICTFNMLSWSADRLREMLGVGKIDYAEIVELSFANGQSKILKKLAPAGKNTINILVTCGQLGNCCAYFIFLTGTLQEMLLKYGIDWNFELLLCVMFLPVLLFGMVKNLYWLSKLSMVFNLIYMGSVITIVGYLFTIIQNPTRLPWIAGYKTLPLFFGSSIFCIECIGCIIPIKNKMAEPQKFTWVLNTATVFMFFMLITFGFIGYSSYGQEIQSSITYNLPMNGLFEAIHILIATSVFASYSVQIFPVVDIILPRLITRFPTISISKLDNCLRLTLVLITFVAALSIPMLNYVLDLIGAIVSSSLALIFPPPVFDAVLSMRQPEWTNFRILVRIMSVILVLLGLIGGTLSTAEAIYGIVRNWGS